MMDEVCDTLGVGANQTTGFASPNVVAYPLQEVGKRTGVSTDDVRAGIGIGHAGDAMYTLQAGAQHGVVAFHQTQALTHEGADASEDGTVRGTRIVAPTLTMGAHTAGPGSNGQDALQWADTMQRAGVGRPRRLTPRECERLMSWPDDWTRWGINDAGKPYELSDTQRYRLCGNGVGSVCVQWIAQRLAEMETSDAQAVAA